MDGRCRRLVEHLMHDALLCVGEILLLIELTATHRSLVSKKNATIWSYLVNVLSRKKLLSTSKGLQEHLHFKLPHQKRIFLSSNYC
jgi:hypothetical protein